MLNTLHGKNIAAKSSMMMTRNSEITSTLESRLNSRCGMRVYVTHYFQLTPIDSADFRRSPAAKIPLTEFQQIATLAGITWMDAKRHSVFELLQLARNAVQKNGHRTPKKRTPPSKNERTKKKIHAWNADCESFLNYWEKKIKSEGKSVPRKRAMGAFFEEKKARDIQRWRNVSQSTMDKRFQENPSEWKPKIDSIVAELADTENGHR